MMAVKSITDGYPLSALLQGFISETSDVDVDVTGIAIDSRKVMPGDLFIACQAGQRSAIPYINAAVKAGASAVVAETGYLPEPFICSVPLLGISDLYTKTGIIADRFYGHPSADMTVIGVTGTNGKTTVSYILAQSLSDSDKNMCGLIGTLGYGRIDNLLPGLNTTPDPITLHHLLADMRDQNIGRVVMEVSSHGLDQYRIAGVDFNIAIFTNLSRDHLDYHGSMGSYADAKRRFFTNHQINRAVINIDDAFGSSLVKELDENVRVIAYTLNTDSNLRLKKNISLVSGKIMSGRSENLSLEVHTPWGEGCLTAHLLGKFNAYNLLAGLSALCLLNYPLDKALLRLSQCKNIPGRMERFGGDQHPRIVIDYAHTPDALEQVLLTLKTLCQGSLYCVFGCGGERDKGKRSQMGAVAERYADIIVITSDNPRHEDPDAIIQNILSGIQKRNQIRIEADREIAITSTIKAATKNDIILIAGKGHENYQDIGGKRFPFSDQQVVRRVLESN